MNNSKIAVRYAKALFDLAGEQNSIDAVYEDMKVIDRLCVMKEVKEIITNPVISQKKRKEIIVALAGEGTDKLTLKFIELVFSHGRGDYLGAAARNYLDLTRRHRGIRQITVTTAVPVSGKIKDELASVITGAGHGAVEFIEQVDGGLMGGFIIRVDDAYIDASVRTRLNRFKKEFSLAGFAE
jgi:F-type H+-transporting ATPase subunit delta